MVSDMREEEEEIVVSGMWDRERAGGGYDKTCMYGIFKYKEIDK